MAFHKGQKESCVLPHDGSVGRFLIGRIFVYATASNHSMKLTALFFLLMVQVPYTFAQQSVSTINVNGRAKKLVMPDLAVFAINATATDKLESAAIKRLNEISNEVL